MDPANVRLKEEEEEEGEVDALQEAEREAVATREAIKRKIQQAAVTTFQPPSLPTKLRIDPNDPDEVVINCNLFFEVLLCSYVRVTISASSSLYTVVIPTMLVKEWMDGIV